MRNQKKRKKGMNLKKKKKKKMKTMKKKIMKVMNLKKNQNLNQQKIKLNSLIIYLITFSQKMI